MLLPYDLDKSANEHEGIPLPQGDDPDARSRSRLLKKRARVGDRDDQDILLGPGQPLAKL